ncbi:MAG: bifunctional folylpolyglutamate synthase/dihydrofolate synthase [Crocinitomicaceae bacterium]|nr:bifunctional folylpolyglutamate synthase/dihydrofolate synthase [Crocinitomicaceae bacterium]
MNYQETVSWLFDQLPNYQLQGTSAYKPGLQNIEKLLDLTGHPEKDLRFFHVAGTNGKGSVSNMLASIMQEHEYKTGLFTSPHLHDFRERIRINGEMISEKFVIDFVARFKDTWKEIQPSFFEITTAMAFSAFKENGCEICIIETGLGGRLDSTNIITPEVSIVTNIGLEHTQFLGDSLEKIAYEKAGIIKPNVPVVIGEWDNETKPVFERAASFINAPLHHATPVSGIESDLQGRFQQKNIATVFKVIEVLRAAGWNFIPQKVSDGLMHVSQNTKFKARFQKLQDKPTVIVDAAHNVDGVRTLFAEIAQMNFEKLHLIYGAANDKDLKSIFKLFPKDATYYFSEFDSKRSVHTDDFIELAGEFNLDADFFSYSGDAIAAAYQSTNENDLIIIFGSFYLVQEFV